MKGKTAAVVGRSNIVGLPVALLLQNEDATVTMVHSRTPNAGGRGVFSLKVGGVIQSVSALGVLLFSLHNAGGVVQCASHTVRCQFCCLTNTLLCVVSTLGVLFSLRERWTLSVPQANSVLLSVVVDGKPGTLITLAHYVASCGVKTLTHAACLRPFLLLLLLLTHVLVVTLVVLVVAEQVVRAADIVVAACGHSHTLPVCLFLSAPAAAACAVLQSRLCVRQTSLLQPVTHTHAACLRFFLWLLLLLLRHLCCRGGCACSRHCRRSLRARGDGAGRLDQAGSRRDRRGDQRRR